MKFLLISLSKDDVTLLLSLVKQSNELCSSKIRFYRCLGSGYEGTIRRFEKLHKRYNALVDVLRGVFNA